MPQCGAGCAVWTDRRTPTPGPRRVPISLGTRPDTPMASKPPGQRPARSHRRTHRDPRNVLLSLVGHGGDSGCRGCLPRCYCLLLLLLLLLARLAQRTAPQIRWSEWCAGRCCRLLSPPPPSRAPAAAARDNSKSPRSLFAPTRPLPLAPSSTGVHARLGVSFLLFFFFSFVVPAGTL